MNDALVSDARANMESMVETIGDDTLKAHGRGLCSFRNQAAGVDMDAVQKSYLWEEGFKMFVMAAIMLLAAFSVSYLAARVGAGVGRDLRSKVFKNVVGFSNAEIDKFSTASLITRSTNDVQQIQMVTAMMLRLVLYAPILGVGGIYKVAQTGANMGILSPLPC